MGSPSTRISALNCPARRAGRPALFLLAALVLAGYDHRAGAAEKVTYDDQVTPILRNSCFKCHNPDKAKGELDLTTYGAVMKGGGAGKSVVPGDAAGSKLFKSIARTEEPFMPDKGPKMSDAEIEVIRNWIAGGLLEKASSQAAVASGPKMAQMRATAAAGKPEGPAVLPVDWLLDPVGRTEHETAITALAASPWFPVIAVGGQHQLLLYQSGTRQLAGVLPFPDGSPTCLQFSRDGRLLVVGGGRGGQFGVVDIYDVATAERVARVGNEYDAVLAADLNSDQTEVALGGPGKRVKIFATRTGQLLRDLKKHTDWITAIQYSPDSVLLATGDRNGGLVVWEADSGQELYTLTGHQSAITALSWRDDSDILLSASEDGSVRLWEMRDGRQVSNWNAHKGGVLDARFSHDARIVSCGRDEEIAVWDASGKKQRGWKAGGELPVRVAFNHDASQVVAGSWQGKVGLWTTADGKPAGELSSNPPTLAEQLSKTTVELTEREARASKADVALASAEGEVTRLKTALGALDRSSPAFQLLAATAQSRTEQGKATAAANRALEKRQSQATKSASELTAWEAEATKLQTALDKTEKIAAPYQQLTREFDAAAKKVEAATAKATEAGQALTNKTAAVSAANAEWGAKITAATAAREKADAPLAELGTRLATATKAAMQAQTNAAPDKAKLTQLQEAVKQLQATLATAEADLAKLAQTGTNADQSSPQGQAFSRQLEAAHGRVAESRLALDKAQKALPGFQTEADKSGALVASADAEASKAGAALETAIRDRDAARAALDKLEISRTASTEAGAKEVAALQAGLTQAQAGLSTAKAERDELQGKLDKTEKMAPAYREASQNLEAAKKKVTALRTAMEYDRSEAADLLSARDKLLAAAGAFDAEAQKTLTVLQKADPDFQHFQELEQQLDKANKAAGEAKIQAGQAQKERDDIRKSVAQLQVAQAHATLYHARESLAKRKEEGDKAAAQKVAAEEEAGKVAKDLQAAQTKLQELSRQVTSLTQMQSSNAVSLTSAQQAAAEAARLLSAEEARVQQLTADHQKLKAALDGPKAEAKH